MSEVRLGPSYRCVCGGYNGGHKRDCEYHPDQVAQKIIDEVKKRSTNMNLPPIPPGSKWFYENSGEIWFRWPDDDPECLSTYTAEEWAVCPWRFIIAAVAIEEWRAEKWKCNRAFSGRVTNEEQEHNRQWAKAWYAMTQWREWGKGKGENDG